MAEEINITAEEWNEYKDVQDSGLVNMFTPDARAMTSLSKDKWNKVKDRMGQVCRAIHEKTDYPDKRVYFSTPYDSKGVESFLRNICNALARDNFIHTPKGKRLGELEGKRKAAIDVVMGMTETEQTVIAINKILKGTKVPLLGGK